MFGRRGLSDAPPPPPPVAEPKTEEVAAQAPVASEGKKPSAAASALASAMQNAAASAQKSSDNKANSSGSAAHAAGGKPGVSRPDRSGELLADKGDGDGAPTPPSQTEMTANKEKIYDLLMEQIDIATSSRLPREELRRQIIELIGEIVLEQRMLLSQAEQQLLANEIVDDMLGFGPLEPLLRDEFVTDIMVNGPWQVYVERKGKLDLSDVKFRDNDHVMAIATRIVTGVGRRVDESSPICDARLPDGSRVNVIAPPLSIKGCSISIRKFSQKKITLDTMASQNNVSENLCKLLKICGAIRLNIIISGGTGSGKTTLLNAISRMINHGERVVTIEDAAELQLQQPHVVPLETRQANLEGTGEITMRDLVKNALRMRPDRIILGEVRGGEAFDLLQAMNTGHDGSMGTCHANNPREALSRMENMINMGVTNLPSKAIRQQIASSINLIVQIQRMRDGMRRVTHVTEVVGMEGDVIVTQDLFTFEFKGEDENGKLYGEFISSGIRPTFMQKAAYFGLEQALLEAMMV